MDNEYLNSKDFMELFYEFPKNFIIPLNAIYDIVVRKTSEENIYYDTMYNNKFIISNCLKDNFKKEGIKKNKELKDYIIIYICVEGYWEEIINSGIEIINGKKTLEKPIMTNNKDINDLKDKYETIMFFKKEGSRKIENLGDNIFKYYMYLDSDFIESIEEYVEIDFNKYNFDSYEKDPELCSTTIYICWN